MPVIQLLWVNTHIYFFLGPLIFLLFFIGEWFKNSSFPKNFLITGLTVGLVNFINPFGWQGVLYPFSVLQNYGYSIVENQGPFFLRAWSYPWLTTYALLAGVVFAAASFLLNYRNFRDNIFGFLLFLAAAILSFKMIRNYPIFALTMIPISMKNFWEATRTLTFYDISQNVRVSSNSSRTGLFLTLLILILVFSVMTNQVYEEARFGRKFGLDVPSGAKAAVDFVRENNLRGPVFNNFDVGSFLIWKLPEEKVFIDGRPEAYPAEFIQNVYIPMQEEPELWDKYSKEYGINYVFWLYSDITPWSQKFVSSILQNSSWPLVYRDNLVMIFVKK